MYYSEAPLIRPPFGQTQPGLNNLAVLKNLKKITFESLKPYTRGRDSGTLLYSMDYDRLSGHLTTFTSLYVKIIH